MLSDRLKASQARQQDIKNAADEYNMGIISQQMVAQELGRDKPDKAKPRFTLSNNDPNGSGPKNVDPATGQQEKVSRPGKPGKKKNVRNYNVPKDSVSGAKNKKTAK